MLLNGSSGKGPNTDRRLIVSHHRTYFGQQIDVPPMPALCDKGNSAISATRMTQSKALQNVLLSVVTNAERQHLHLSCLSAGMIKVVR